MLWRVSNGNSIHIWGDNWLLTPSHWIQSRLLLLDSKANVVSLINNLHHQLISEICTSKETNAICSIPLSRLGVEDKLSWWLARNGLFSVKLAYVLEMT